MFLDGCCWGRGRCWWGVSCWGRGMGEGIWLSMLEDQLCCFVGEK